MQDLLVFRWHQEDLYEFQGSPKRGSSRGFQWASYEDPGELNRAFWCVSVAFEKGFTRVSKKWGLSGCLRVFKGFPGNLLETF